MGALVVGLCPIHASAQDYIKIGVAGPMSGLQAAFGAQLMAGAEAAVKDINDAGGVLGRKLLLVAEDDGGNPAAGAAVAAKFVGLHRVEMVVGHFHSHVTLAASDVYRRSGVLMITPSATLPRITEQGMWNVFRTCGRDDQQAAVAATLISQKFKDKSIAIVYEDTAFGRALAAEARNALGRVGAKERIYETLPRDAVGLGTLADRLDGTDVIYVAGDSSYARDIESHMRKQSIAVLAPASGTVTGPTRAGVIGIVARKFETISRNRTLVNALKARQQPFGGSVMNAYAAVEVWAQAATRARTTDAQKVAEALRAGKWDTAIGKIVYDAKGDLKSRNNYLVYLNGFNPSADTGNPACTQCCLEHPEECSCPMCD